MTCNATSLETLKPSQGLEFLPPVMKELECRAEDILSQKVSRKC